jgi:hypothetical protein
MMPIFRGNTEAKMEQCFELQLFLLESLASAGINSAIISSSSKTEGEARVAGACCNQPAWLNWENYRRDQPSPGASCREVSGFAN